MTQYYTIFGRQIASQYLAIGTLTTMFTGVYLSVGGSKAPAATPPINASSSDEADFIKKFIENAEAEEKAKAPAKH